jgi:predicted kinase
MCGLPGAGKTTIAGRLHAYLGGALIRSCDVFRDLGISLPAWIERTRGFRAGVEAYGRLRDQAYVEMASRVERALAVEELVIVDAVHGEPAKRRALYEITARHRGEPVLVLCRCDDLAETRRRIDARRGREHIPEHEACDFSVYEDIARRWQAPGADDAPVMPAQIMADTFRGEVAVTGALSTTTRRIAEAVRTVATLSSLCNGGDVTLGTGPNS